MPANDTGSRIASTISRRSLLTSSGYALAAAVGGASLLGGSEPTRAQVSSQSLSVSDETYTAESVRPTLTVDAAYEYTVSETPDEVRLYCMVDSAELDSSTIPVSQSEQSGTTTLSGGLVSLPVFVPADFETTPGGQTQQSVSVKLVLQVRRDGATVADAIATDTATVTVAHPDSVSVTASVGGSGSFGSN